MRAHPGAIVTDREYIAAADARRLLRFITFLFAAQLHCGGVMRARWLFLAVPLLFLVSCDTPTETTDSTDPNFKKPIPLKQSCYDPDDPLCLPGPSPDDPDPDAPGYFIGLDYNMAHCRQSNDLDDDGFDDNCEYRIARRFKPLLATNPGDDTSREPYWVVRYDPDLPGTIVQGVWIMYLFSYHRDFGIILPGDDLSGDSEYVVIHVTYVPSTKHWVLTTAYYAAHGVATFWAQTQLQFPDGQLGGYPRVWVTNKKHGSYISERSCNSGGELGWDDCRYNVDDERVEVSPYRNLGSGTNRFLNCVYSENPIAYQGTECFWNAGYSFCGWDLDRTDCSTPYYDPLSAAGFAGIQ
jgi:hypothetical protein